MMFILSLVSDFHCDVDIGAFAIDIVGIERFFASAFKNLAFATAFAVMEAFPLCEYIGSALFRCGRMDGWSSHCGYTII